MNYNFSFTYEELILLQDCLAESKAGRQDETKYDYSELIAEIEELENKLIIK